MNRLLFILLPLALTGCSATWADLCPETVAFPVGAQIDPMTGQPKYSVGITPTYRLKPAPTRPAAASETLSLPQ